MTEKLRYGTWDTDEAGLPCFNLAVGDNDAPEAPFRHLIGTGRLLAMADRWGRLHLFTTEGGFLWLNKPGDQPVNGSLYLKMEAGGKVLPLLHGALTRKDGIRIGVGHIEYSGEIKTEGVHLRVVQQFYARPDRGRVLFARFSLTNLGNAPLQARVKICSDVTCAGAGLHPILQPGLVGFSKAHEQLGDIFLAAAPESQPSAEQQTLALGHAAVLAPGKTWTADVATGYGNAEAVSVPTLDKVRKQWSSKLEPFRVDAPEEWMRQECLWNAGQLLSFTCYDSSVDEYFIALGGYGWGEFGVREVAETSMVLADCDWELAACSLRFVAKTQLASGDIPKMHTMRRDRKVREFESDNELWFVIGSCESIASSGKTQFWDEPCGFWDQGEGSIWEHAKRAFYWVRDGIGLGSHGLILMRQGDWNDYLSLVGAGGRGESVMNSGMACFAFTAMADVARRRGETQFVTELEAYTAKLRQAVNAVFDQGWFLRGYTDNGKPVGSYEEGRLFINAQSWCSLAKCGTPEQRKTALKNAVARCHTDIGLMLMSLPYSGLAPEGISVCAFPDGEGENAGIWPQTIYWMVWALAEEGLVEEAFSEWICGTLRNHSRRFPEVPYGIFNGPDCFSSKCAGEREGWTQLELVDRARTVPMNPMIAWQSFAMKKINRAKKA